MRFFSPMVNINVYLINFFLFNLTIQRKNEFLQRNSKPEDREIEKERNNKLTSHGKSGTFLQYSCSRCVV